MPGQGGGTGADPELAGPGVCVELLGVPPGQRPEVKRRPVVAAVVALSFRDGLKDQDGVRLVVEAEPGEVRESGVGAEAVVAVVGADFQRAGRDHQALALELSGDCPAPGCGVAGYGVTLRELLACGRPVAGHEGLESVGAGPL